MSSLVADDLIKITTEKSNPAAVGKRMRYRIQELLDEPYSWMPSYADRYKLLLDYCDTLTPHQAYALTMLLGPDAARGYAPIPNTFALTFPEAHAVDLTAQVGWYYFAGQVRTKEGVEFGILLMMFQYTLLPPTVAQHFGLTPIENQVMDVQLAITEAGGRMHQAAPSFLAGTNGDIEIADRLFVCAGDNLVDTPAKGVLFPMTLRASGEDRGGQTPIPVEIDLTLTSGKGILLQGADGCEPCIAGLGTRYYSIPNLSLNPGCSTLQIGDTVHELGSGRFWMDHQWGTGMIPQGASPHPIARAAANLSGPSIPGWDFFVMNFDDGSAITLNHLHTPDDLPWIDQSGPNPPPVKPASPVVGKYMDPQGTVFNIWGAFSITKWARAVTSPDPDLYPISNVWFPHGWTFELCPPVLPAHLRKLRFEPISDDPGAMFFANTAQYVESPVTIYDANNVVCGRGFGEAVGYHNFLPTAAALAGLTPDAIKKITPVSPSPLLKLLSFIYVLLGKKELAAITQCGSIPPTAKPCDCT